MADRGRIQASSLPECAVMPLPGIGGERRRYRGVAQPFAAHSHGHYVIGRVESGERVLELNGEETTIGPGDLIVFNPGDVHGCRSASSEPFAYDSVTVAADVLDGVRLGPPREGMSEASREGAAEASRAFDGLVDALDAFECGGEVLSDEEIVDRVLHLACLLEVAPREDSVEDSVEDSEEAAPSVREQAALRVYAYLRGHLAQAASVADLAAAEGLSEYALIRAYRKRFSITPLQHLMSLRVELACGLLAHGIAAADVAAEAGFCDQAHMTRAFKQRMGVTPAAYGRMVARDGAAGGGGVRQGARDGAASGMAGMAEGGPR